LRLGARRSHPLTLGPLGAAGAVNPSWRVVHAAPSMAVRLRETTMLDDAKDMMRMLAACLLGGGFAVALILGSLPG
jgi:hypothetical protein